jgi:hypothetical protein
MHETVIVQVVVNVGDEDGECDAPPEFLDIPLDLGPMLAQRIDDFGVGMFGGTGSIGTELRVPRHLAGSVLTIPSRIPTASVALWR